MKRCQASHRRKDPRLIRAMSPQSAAAVVRIAAWQQARLHHVSKSNSSKIILMISETSKQSFFLQLHRLDIYFLKHVHHQIFNPSIQSGTPNSEYKMTRNIRYILSVPMKSYERNYPKSEALFHHQLAAARRSR